jgi:BRO1-like domain
MLSVERKKTEKVDLIKPLSTYIKTQYSEKVGNDHTEVLNNLQQLREDVRNSQDKSDAIKELLLKYG